MPDATKLIYPEDVRTNTPIRGSVDNDYINPAIRRVQDTRLAYVLGSKLLEKLQAIQNGTESDNSDERYNTLLTQYVQPYMWWEVCFCLLLVFLYALDNVPFHYSHCTSK
jgi:hypothetical protein